MNDADTLQAAQAGDEAAFERLVSDYRRELYAHCYRMLGSVADAEDALQEALLRAWRALPRFEGRSSLRSWLYRIATNACLRLIERRPPRVLPIDYGPAADPHDDPAAPLVESVWIEPYPDDQLPVDAGYEQRPVRLRSRRACAVDAAQQRMHARDELARAERLRQVVVGADGQPDDLVGLRVARGQHQHRHGPVVLDAAAHLEAVEAGQHEVEDDEVGTQPLAHLDAAGAVVGDLDDESLTAQASRDRRRDRSFVFDHDDRAGRGGGRRSRRHCTTG